MSGSVKRAPQGYQQLTVSTSAVSLTIPATSNVATFALIRCSTANIRWRDDGTAPTSTVGEPLNAGEILEYDGQLSKFQAIRSGAADATLDIEYYA